MLASVAQPMGCCMTEEGKYETTIYSACCNASHGGYYYTTCRNQQITAVDMRRENLDADRLIRYRLIFQQQIRLQNG